MERLERDGYTALLPDEAKSVLLVLIGSPDEAESVKTALPEIAVCALLPAEWNRDCTPWPAPGLGKKDPPFGGGADGLLRFLSGSVLTELCARGLLPPLGKRVLAGYSLGGLTALYALYHGLPFGFFGSLSGSLWYPGWPEYAETRMPEGNPRVYLSLGNKEPKARHPMLRQVGEGTEKTKFLLRKQLGEDRVFFEWNEGGHFADIGERFGKLGNWLAGEFLKDDSIR